jgi:CDP-diacylglycerol--serine O-phosphatidyltransferase
METAILLVFLAMVFDALDGKVARLTNQATDFGAQLDSLSDVVTFGVAPAAMAKVLLAAEGVGRMPFLDRHPRLLFLTVAVYALFAIMRLARFNVETATHEEKDHNRFKGLPTPAAGGLVAATILFWLHRQDEILSHLPPWLFDGVIRAFPWALVLIGLAMVSPLPYPHMVNVLFRRRKSFLFLGALVLALVVAAINYETALLGCLLAYFIAGPVVGLVELVAGHRRRRSGHLRPPRSVAG